MRSICSNKEVSMVETSKGMEVQDSVSVVSDISMEVERLHTVLDNAEARLKLILAPEYASDSVEKMSDPTPLRSFVRQTHIDLSRQIDRLVALLDRVEA
jgi:hypothetical protein